MLKSGLIFDEHFDHIFGFEFLLECLPRPALVLTRIVRVIADQTVVAFKWVQVDQSGLFSQDLSRVRHPTDQYRVLFVVVVSALTRLAFDQFERHCGPTLATTRITTITTPVLITALSQMVYKLNNNYLISRILDFN